MHHLSESVYTRAFREQGLAHTESRLPTFICTLGSRSLAKPCLEAPNWLCASGKSESWDTVLLELEAAAATSLLSVCTSWDLPG